MIRKTCVLLAMVIAATLCFFSAPSFFSSAGYGPYAVTSPVVVDGDTIKADVPLWPGITAHASIRVAGVDTPELNSSNACEREFANIAKIFTQKWVNDHVPLIISTVTPDKYAGRVDAVVRGADGSLLAGALIAANIGRPYNGGARQPWCTVQ